MSSWGPQCQPLHLLPPPVEQSTYHTTYVDQHIPGPTATSHHPTSALPPSAALPNPRPTLMLPCCAVPWHYPDPMEKRRATPHSRSPVQRPPVQCLCSQRKKAETDASSNGLARFPRFGWMNQTRI